jgi:hypothetical protein
MAFILDKTLLAPKEGMFSNKPVSNQFLLEDIDAHIEEEALTLATKVLEVPKEEMEEETTVLDVPRKEMEEEEYLANKVLHTTCSHTEEACDLLIEGDNYSLYKKVHHYTLRPKKDKTKSKPTVKMKN